MISLDPVTMGTSASDSSSKDSTPVEFLHTDIGRIFSNIHPALLLSAYYFRLPALVADPVPTLLNSLPLLAVIQIAYVASCLPPIGTGSSSKAIKKGKSGVKKTGTSAAVQLLVSKPCPMLEESYFNCFRRFSTLFR
jgi:phosphatidylinositol glycan class F